MKGPVISAWIAAGLFAASGAQAQQADCDMICRLQGYLSTDHMAAPTDGSQSPAAGAAGKHRPHVSKKVVKAEPKATTKREPDGDVAKIPVKTPAKIAKALPTAKPSAPKAAARDEPNTARPANVVGIAPRPPMRETSSTEPTTRHIAAATDLPSAPSARPSRPARTLPHFARKSAPQPVASAALIPGSAPLVPAEFQTFGNL